jgi:hypothetical protein
VIREAGVNSSRMVGAGIVVALNVLNTGTRWFGKTPRRWQSRPLLKGITLAMVGIVYECFLAFGTRPKCGVLRPMVESLLCVPCQRPLGTGGTVTCL